MAIELGYISGCHGVRGWLKVFSYSDPVDNIFNYPKWLIDDREVEVIASKTNGRKLISKLESIDSIEQAQLLIGKKISLAELPKLETNQYYWHQLIGLNVINHKQQFLGKVMSIFATGANDVLVVADQNQRHLIPYTFGIHILKVNLTAHQITVDWQSDY